MCQPELVRHIFTSWSEIYEHYVLHRGGSIGPQRSQRVKPLKTAKHFICRFLELKSLRRLEKPAMHKEKYIEIVIYFGTFTL